MQLSLRSHSELFDALGKLGLAFVQRCESMARLSKIAIGAS
jgi:hypothetical protein